MYSDYLDNFYRLLKDTVFWERSVLKSPDDFFASVTLSIHKVFEKKKFLFFLGNGASHSMGDHFSADFSKNAKVKTLSLGGSLQSAYSNDHGFENTFAHFLKSHSDDIGLVVAISSSGESPNILSAVKSSLEEGIPSLSFTGKSKENSLRGLSTYSIYCPSHYYGEVESAHAFMLHYIIDLYLDTYGEGRI